MANNENPFKSIEEKFLERQKAQANKSRQSKQKRFGKKTEGPKEPKKPFDPAGLKKYLKTAIGLTVVFALLLILLANVYIVKENEYRVVRQFGEVVKIVDTPGVRFKVPFVQSVSALPKNQMAYNVSEAEITTKDKKRMIIDNYAIWRITDPKKMINNARNIVNAESRMEEYIYSVVRSEFGRLDYAAIVNDKDSSRGNLNDTVTERVNELLEAGNFGIAVTDVRMKRIDLPPENEQSIYTRMISERESTAQTYLSEGDAEKRRIEAETDREVQELLAKVKKDAEVIRAEGEAEAARIYNTSFSKDPEFYELYRTLESYKKTIGKETMIILPSDSPYARILSGYLD
ncbi:protease modulator HflC [Edaphobacillus lindanitolerans]|uniref:Protein HflC n=1 Tax=Edaphobacillus lindanitolerans TaxID=550447 RepID=A0A1U7PKG1_9BACI|nr:protease modulator HflC [Edaphobacillus lindanitolerans]SIT84908.1 protease FtsH subunit HflC [Edaphobacillus lindanitolerans]